MAGARPGDHLDLEGLAQQAAGAQRGEAAVVGAEVRPRRRRREPLHRQVRVGHRHRLVGLPDAPAGRGRGWRERPDLGVGHPPLGAVGLPLGGALEDDPPAAPRRVGVAAREPRAEEPVSALEEVPPREPPAASVPAEAPPVGAVERPQVRQVQPPAAEPAPAGGEDAEGQAQVVNVALRLRARVVGGVEEVRDPGRGVRGRDRGPRHPREAHGAGRSGLDRAVPAHRRARMKAVSPYEVTGTMPRRAVEALGARARPPAPGGGSGPWGSARGSPRSASGRCPCRWRSGATRMSAM